MSKATNIVARLLEDDELDPKEFIVQSAAAKKFDLRPYTNAKDVLRVVHKWPCYAGNSGNAEVGYMIDFYQELPIEGGFPGEYIHTIYWQAMLELKPGRKGNLIIVYMFTDANGDEWEIERLQPEALERAYAELDPRARKFIKKLHGVAVFTVRSPRFVGEAEEDFDPTAEIDHLHPKLQARLVPHERSTVEHPSWHVYHPLSDDWHLGTVQYAPIQDFDKPWAANPEGKHHDIAWHRTRDEAVRHIERLFIKKKRVREADEDFDPTEEVDRLTAVSSKAVLEPSSASTTARPAFNVSSRKGRYLGTVFYDDSLSEEFPWCGAPDSAKHCWLWYTTKAGAVSYVLRSARFKVDEAEEEFDPKSEADRLTGPITQEQLAAWMTVAGFYDFSFKSVYRDGKPYLEVTGKVNALLRHAAEKLELFLERRRLDTLEGRVTRYAVPYTVRPSEPLPRTVWFLLPLEHIVPDPPRRVSEDELDPTAFVDQHLQSLANGAFMLSRQDMKDDWCWVDMLADFGIVQVDQQRFAWQKDLGLDAENAAKMERVRSVLVRAGGGGAYLSINRVKPEVWERICAVIGDPHAHAMPIVLVHAPTIAESAVAALLEDDAGLRPYATARGNDRKVWTRCHRDPRAWQRIRRTAP